MEGLKQISQSGKYEIIRLFIVLKSGDLSPLEG